jgi:hypothetical protein
MDFDNLNGAAKGTLEASGEAYRSGCKMLDDKETS